MIREYDLGPFLRIEQRIVKHETTGIRERWDYGRKLLAERDRNGGKQLPNGLLDQLVEASGKSRAELQYRAKFAERYTTEDEVSNAFDTYGSWHAIVSEGLSPRSHHNREDDSGRRELEEPDMAVTFVTRTGPFASALADVRDADVLITDPPYTAEALPLYRKMADAARDWLRPGGLCAVMCGQTHFPAVLPALTKHLDYRWLIAYLTPGGQAVQIFPRQVNTFWKPVVVLTNGKRDDDRWIGDVTRSDVNDNDKRFHEWGQSESGMADLVRRLSEPGEVVLDPFMGAGTTGVAALAAGRSFIGCDTNDEHVRDADARLAQVQQERAE